MSEMEHLDKAKKDMYAWTARYAEKAGYDLNPDEGMLDLVLEGMARNHLKYGKKYCPCRIVTGDEKEDKKIICPCVYHKDEIDTNGSCHCELFFKKEQ